MKRTLASVAAAGLLTVGLTACGGAEEEPVGGPTAPTEAPGDDEQTSAPGAPDGDGQSGVAPDPEAQEFCDTVSELVERAGGDPQQQVDLILELRDAAPEEIRPDMDVLAEQLEGLSAEDLEATEAPDSVDQEALEEANADVDSYLRENCAPTM